MVCVAVGWRVDDNLDAFRTLWRDAVGAPVQRAQIDTGSSGQIAFRDGCKLRRIIG